MYMYTTTAMVMALTMGGVAMSMSLIVTIEWTVATCTWIYQSQSGEETGHPQRCRWKIKYDTTLYTPFIHALLYPLYMSMEDQVRAHVIHPLYTFVHAPLYMHL